MLRMMSESPVGLNKRVLVTINCYCYKVNKEFLVLFQSFTWISDGKSSDVEVFTAGGAEINVVARVVVHTGLGQHGVVLSLTLSANRSMGREQKEKKQF